MPPLTDGSTWPRCWLGCKTSTQTNKQAILLVLSCGGSSLLFTYDINRLCHDVTLIWNLQLKKSFCVWFFLLPKTTKSLTQEISSIPHTWIGASVSLYGHFVVQWSPLHIRQDTSFWLFNLDSGSSSGSWFLFCKVKHIQWLSGTDKEGIWW